MRAPRAGRPLGGPITIRATVEPRPTADMLKQRPHFLPGIDTSYPTPENLDAQQQWLGHIQAGRIKVA
jgi:hypothetical protein